MRAFLSYSLYGTVLVALSASGLAQETPLTDFDATIPTIGFPPPVASLDPAASNISQAAFEQEGYSSRLFTKFDDGFVIYTENEEFELRIKLMQQTDAKLFIPQEQEPARPGLYIPRFRLYFEGNITQSYEYELSLQRSVEGSFDLLDANINFRPSEEFQVRFGRFLVPFSYDWYDHLEQFFITPERSLFTLNFGLSRADGLMFVVELQEGKLEYALGGFSGQLTGLADTNGRMPRFPPITGTRCERREACATRQFSGAVEPGRWTVAQPSQGTSRDSPGYA